MEISLTLTLEQALTVLYVIARSFATKQAEKRNGIASLAMTRKRLCVTNHVYWDVRYIVVLSIGRPLSLIWDIVTLSV